jgi:hypothetical protein
MPPARSGRWNIGAFDEAATCAVQQVISFPGYSGRAANVDATVESDPKLPFGDVPIVRLINLGLAASKAELAARRKARRGGRSHQ